MKKRLIVEVSDRFHRDLRLRAYDKNLTIKSYVLTALIEYMNKEKNEQKKDIN